MGTLSALGFFLGLHPQGQQSAQAPDTGRKAEAIPRWEAGAHADSRPHSPAEGPSLIRSLATWVEAEGFALRRQPGSQMALGPTALMQLKGGRGGWSHSRGPGSRSKLQKGLRSPRSETNPLGRRARRRSCPLAFRSQGGGVGGTALPASGLCESPLCADNKPLFI